MTPTILQEVVQAVRGLTEEQQREVFDCAKKMREENNDCGEASAKPKKKIWEVITEIMQELSPDAFEGYPTDGSLNHDHYLYGSPKQEQK